MIIGARKVIQIVIMLLLSWPEGNGSSSEERIAGGHPAKVGDFPYAVYLSISRITGNSFCSGSIIHPQWILTAAHCTRDSFQIRVFAGVSAGYTGDRRKAQVRQSVDYIIHPGFGNVMGLPKPKKYYDYSLIRLDRSFDMRDISVGVVELVDNPWQINNACKVVGFGHNPDGRKGMLFSVDLDVMHGDRLCPCKVKKEESEHYICSITGENKKSVCAGDSGGPMVCGNKQVGVGGFFYNRYQCNLFVPKVLKKFGCGVEGTVNVYVYLCPVLSWIRHYVGTQIPRDMVDCYVIRECPLDEMKYSQGR